MLGHRRIYDGKVLALDVDEVQEPEDVRATREVVRHRGSVAALPVQDDGRVVLIRQYRYAVDERVWEIPAGRLDPGETPGKAPAASSKRSWDSQASVLEPLLELYTTPGFCDERLHLFRASGLTEGLARPEADERIERGTFALEEAQAMIRRGEVRDAKTLIALLLESERRR